MAIPKFIEVGIKQNGRTNVIVFNTAQISEIVDDGYDHPVLRMSSGAEYEIDRQQYRELRSVLPTENLEELAGEVWADMPDHIGDPQSLGPALNKKLTDLGLL
jgi:hypothetical protein